MGRGSWSSSWGGIRAPIDGTGVNRAAALKAVVHARVEWLKGRAFVSSFEHRCSGGRKSMNSAHQHSDYKKKSSEYVHLDSLVGTVGFISVVGGARLVVGWRFVDLSMFDCNLIDVKSVTKNGQCGSYI